MFRIGTLGRDNPLDVGLCTVIALLAMAGRHTRMFRRKLKAYATLHLGFINSPSPIREYKMKNTINYLVICSLLTSTACAGHDPNPVMVSQYGDERKSCKSLQLEIFDTQGEMQKIVGNTDKTGKNIALGVAGWFLLVPWFFMDFKNGEKVEYDALRQRYMHLSIIAEDKHCSVDSAHIPTSDELLKAAKKAHEEADYPEQNTRH